MSKTTLFDFLRIIANKDEIKIELNALLFDCIAQQKVETLVLKETALTNVSYVEIERYGCYLVKYVEWSKDNVIRILLEEAR